MPKHPVTLHDPQATGTALAAAFVRIRDEFDVPAEFPAAALAEAETVAAGIEDRAARVPDAVTDLRDLEFFTIDPAGSMDLDQAMVLARDGEGYRVRYAIADVPSVVRPGGAVDAEAWRRVETIYLPDERAPLHPPVLSEGAASLLPGVDRRAFVWDIVLDHAGEATSWTVAPALVRSRRRYDYGQAQAALADGSAAEGLRLLEEIGRLRVAAEARRGGASLPMPEQEIHRDGDAYSVRFRPPVPMEEWNAQISLLTGMVAARIMLDAGVGILRTMPQPEADAVATLRRQARTLGVEWPEGMRYGDFIRGLDRTDPAHLALIHAATGLFRGAGYTAFDGSTPEVSEHAAVAAPYAHVTAPLRRLVDRYGLALCAAVVAGQDVPAWVREALPRLPETMREGDHRAAAVDRAATDAVEAAVLAHRVGEVFDATVIRDRGDKGVLLSITDPSVVAQADGHAEAGDSVRATLARADIASRTVAFALTPPEGRPTEEATPPQA